MLEFLKALFSIPTLFLLYINDLPDNVVCNIIIYADDTTRYSKCDHASDLWQQLKLLCFFIALRTQFQMLIMACFSQTTN